MSQMIRINTRISFMMNEWLDSESKKTGIPKSTLIHLALEHYYNQKKAFESVDALQVLKSELDEIKKHVLATTENA